MFLLFPDQIAHIAMEMELLNVQATLEFVPLVHLPMANIFPPNLDLDSMLSASNNSTKPKPISLMSPLTISSKPIPAQQYNQNAAKTLPLDLIVEPMMLQEIIISSMFIAKIVIRIVISMLNPIVNQNSGGLEVVVISFVLERATMLLSIGMEAS